jgi:outer membrane protein
LEVRDQERRGENVNKLITYLDPTVDVSLGDLIGSRRLKDTFVGLGVSHRSGIFGFSRLLGNVDGGSNYIYTYVEFAI